MEADKEERRKLSVVVVSDTHGEMHALKDLFGMQGDIFIHAGDFTDYGREKDFFTFMKQLDRLNFRHKVVIAGNHEINLDNGCISAKKKEAYQKRYPCKVAHPPARSPETKSSRSSGRGAFTSNTKWSVLRESAYLGPPTLPTS